MGIHAEIKELKQEILEHQEDLAEMKKASTRSTLEQKIEKLKLKMTELQAEVAKTAAPRDLDAEIMAAEGGAGDVQLFKLDVEQDSWSTSGFADYFSGENEQGFYAAPKNLEFVQLVRVRATEGGETETVAVGILCSAEKLEPQLVEVVAEWAEASIQIDGKPLRVETSIHLPVDEQSLSLLSDNIQREVEAIAPREIKDAAGGKSVFKQLTVVSAELKGYLKHVDIGKNGSLTKHEHTEQPKPDMLQIGSEKWAALFPRNRYGPSQLSGHVSSITLQMSDGSVVEETITMEESQLEFSHPEIFAKQVELPTSHLTFRTSARLPSTCPPSRLPAHPLARI